MFFDNVRKETIYVSLLGEGTVVWRPVLALQVGQGIFVVLTKAYDPENEEWEFPPGSIVMCRNEMREGRETLIAVSQINPDAVT
jgi:hypothetical protein